MAKILRNVFILIIGLLVIMLGIDAILHALCVNVNDEIFVVISDLNIEYLSEIDDYLIEYDFKSYDWSDDLLGKVKENPDDYAYIEICYVVGNQTEDTVLKDVRFHPKFTGELSNMMLEYNSGNGEYYLFAQPGFETGMQHEILINTKGKTKEEIYDLVLGESVEMTYYTGDFMNNTGHGYTGPGKQKYIFSISGKYRN